MNDLIYLFTYHKHVVSFVWRDCLEQSLCMLKIGCLNPGCDAPKSLKQKWLFHCQTLRNKCECHGRSSEMTLKRCGKLKFTAQLPRASGICLNLQSFRGNDDFCIWLKNHKEDRYTAQTNSISKFIQNSIQ